MRGLSTGYGRGCQERLTRWLAWLDIPYKIHVRAVGDQVLGDGIRTTLVDERTKVSVSLADVGSGVGQVLPMLVQAAFGDAQILCVEQPELHLHPRAQAALGDVLLDSVEDDELGHEKWPRRTARLDSTQWIVETHSETLLLRLKKRIREGRLRPEQICVLYVNPGKGGSRVARLRLNEQGDFVDEWPHGFFEEAFDEVFS